ncbi:hypothetical protein ASPCADRAFT_127491 [Aspergillus carbonarius ITEM 5010]|uniref:MACPF domain-containing protein n=1 Tax=Aspergillus carbonarius (strain ITEM 5010) TaxID=602072 RepID=A0A1R3RWP8_ASPC5|nr:hypothetical protein ASPCADRAFT_127491 [Aspergillus carbonarius ITEM 5010]
MSAAEPSAGSTDNATESPTADSNETHTDPAATNGQRPASATDQEDGHSNGNSHHTAQQNGDLIIHLVKIFNDGTEAAYSSTVVDRSIYSQTLRDLRANLSKQQVLDSQANRRRFCTKSRSEVNDSLLFKTYMRMIEGGKATTSKQPSEGGDAGVGPAPSHEATIYITALTTRKARTGFDMNSIPKPDLKLSTDKAVLHEATLKHLDSQYEASLWEAKATATQNVHPYEMSEEEWALVVANNGLTCGYNLKTHDIEKTLGDTTVTTGKQVVGLEHSLHPAFTIKSRGLEEHELFHKVGVEAPTRLARIPRIRVTDDSRVDVVETSSAFETALVKAGFSEHSYEASIGGGAFGISAGVSGGEAENHEDHDLNAGISPGWALLDEGCLELSQECKRDWLMVKGDPKKEQEFFDKYGRYFTTRVELGGKLTTTKEVGKKEDLKKTETKDGMKWAAGLSINGQYAGASFRTSHESQSAESNTQDTKGLDVAINWEAHGGDTLLANR